MRIFTMKKSASATLQLQRSRFFFLSLVLLSFISCASPKPITEYAFARQALASAKKANALKFAPELLHQAELTYQKGEVAFRSGDHAIAKDLFNESQRFAEKAEDEARLKSFQSGDFGP